MRIWQDVMNERYPDPADYECAMERIAESRATIEAEQRAWARRHPISNAIQNWRRAQDMRRWKREDPTLYAALTED